MQTHTRLAQLLSVGGWDTPGGFFLLPLCPQREPSRWLRVSPPAPTRARRRQEGTEEDGNLTSRDRFGGPAPCDVKPG